MILLCYSDTLSAEQADAQTLITLLHLRDIASRSDQKSTHVPTPRAWACRYT